MKKIILTVFITSMLTSCSDEKPSTEIVIPTPKPPVVVEKQPKAKEESKKPESAIEKRYRKMTKSKLDLDSKI